MESSAETEPDNREGQVQDARNDHTEPDDDESAPFAAVLSRLNLDRLPALCVSIRKESAHPLRTPGNPIEKATTEPPIFGAYHVLFPIRFTDGIRWILKIPQCGTPEQFDQLDASSLRSEALTMQFIRRETSVPIPDVFAFDSTLENELGCPFILMEFIEGKDVYDCWFDKTICNEELRARRTRTLRDIACAMAELGRFSFTTGGAITFDEDGNLAAPGPMRVLDHSAMLKQLGTDEEDETTLYFEAGPFSDAQSFYLYELDRAEEPQDSSDKGTQKLLRMFLSWLPQLEDPQFVIEHPDLGIRNVIVSEDGSVQALLDWDGVDAVPRLVGNERYPSWLTRDWDPIMYAWNEDMERGIKGDTVWEDSPDTLASHRREYNDFMQQFLSPQHRAILASSAAHFPSVTRLSLLAENLLIAAGTPWCTVGILETFVNEILKLAQRRSDRLDTTEASHNDAEASDFDDLTVFDVPDTLGDGEPEEEEKIVKVLKRGFYALLEQA